MSKKSDATSKASSKRSSVSASAATVKSVSAALASGRDRGRGGARGGKVSGAGRADAAPRSRTPRSSGSRLDLPAVTVTKATSNIPDRGPNACTWCGARASYSSVCETLQDSDQHGVLDMCKTHHDFWHQKCHGLPWTSVCEAYHSDTATAQRLDFNADKFASEGSIADPPVAESVARNTAVGAEVYVKYSLMSQARLYAEMDNRGILKTQKNIDAFVAGVPFDYFFIPGSSKKDKYWIFQRVDGVGLVTLKLRTTSAGAKQSIVIPRGATAFAGHADGALEHLCDDVTGEVPLLADAIGSWASFQEGLPSDDHHSKSPGHKSKLRATTPSIGSSPSSRNDSTTQKSMSPAPRPSPTKQPKISKHTRGAPCDEPPVPAFGKRRLGFGCSSEVHQVLASYLLYMRFSWLLSALPNRLLGRTGIVVDTPNSCSYHRRSPSKVSLGQGLCQGHEVHRAACPVAKDMSAPRKAASTPPFR